MYAAVGPVDVLGNAPTVIDAGLGEFNAFNKQNLRSHAARLELRIGRKLAFVGPAIGVMVNGDHGRYGYAGIYSELAYGRFLLTALVAAGIYRTGESLNLGGDLEIRESLEFAYRISDRWRAGVCIGHLSNGGIHEGNPGQQDLFLTVAAAF